MELGLKDKVVLVTGGSKGIGFACARAFAGEGARVAIASRKRENLDHAGTELRRKGMEVLAIAADFTRPEDAVTAIAAVEHSLGPIAVLVNSAGAARPYALDQYDADAWREGMEAKFFPYVHAMDAVRPHMIERRCGSIVNIVGLGGKFAFETHLSGGAANAALMLVTAGMAHALGPYGIRVNAINPALTFTERLQQVIRLSAQRQGVTEAEVLERDQARIPLRRYARPEEVAAVALFLASDQASYVTGAVIPMDAAATPVI